MAATTSAKATAQPAPGRRVLPRLIPSSLGTRLALTGLAIGLPVAAMGVRAIEGSLFRVSPWSAVMWVVPALLLGATVVAAGYLPALRASRTDPAAVLRSE